MAIPLDHIIHFICFMSAKGKASRSISTYISSIIHVTIQSLNINKSLIATKLGGGGYSTDSQTGHTSLLTLQMLPTLLKALDK